MVENEKRKNRGGDDFVSLGKRKQPEPNIPLSILRKPQRPEPTNKNKKQMRYGPRTQVFNIDGWSGLLK